MGLTAAGPAASSRSALQLVLHRVVEGNVDRVLHDRAESVVAAVSAGTRGTDLAVPEPRSSTRASSCTTRRAGSGPGSASARVREQMARLSRRDRRRTTVRRRRDSTSSTPCRSPPAAAPRGVVVVTETLTPYERGRAVHRARQPLVGSWSWARSG